MNFGLELEYNFYKSSKHHCHFVPHISANNVLNIDYRSTVSVNSENADDVLRMQWQTVLYLIIYVKFKKHNEFSLSF